jgi:hypothetical protein
MNIKKYFQAQIRLLIPLAVVAINGCTTVRETVYLNSLDVSGPIEQPPIHISNKVKAREIHLTPRFSYNQNRQFHSHAAGDTYQDYSSSEKGENFHWETPAAQFGLDIDYLASDHIALNLGVNFAAMHGTVFWGGNMGMGFPFSGPPLAGRVECGLQWQSIAYDAYSVVVREVTSWWSSSTETSVMYFHDVKRATPWNIYTTLTLNTISDGFLNGFTSISLSWQTAASFHPRHIDTAGPLYEYHYTDTRADNSMTFLIITPGFVFSLSPSISLLTGIRIMKEMQLDHGKSTLIVPLMQVDLKF